MRTKTVQSKQQKTAKPKRKWGAPQGNKPLKIHHSKATQAQVVALFLTRHKKAQISRELGIDREAVVRILWWFQWVDATPR